MLPRCRVQVTFNYHHARRVVHGTHVGAGHGLPISRDPLKNGPIYCLPLGMCFS